MKKGSDKIIRNSFNMPTSNQKTTDNFLNELTSEKKIGSREFFTSS